jgi:predicted Rossmann fold nucleotide-binding protein DprA/Smf involved in DNA uptake
MEIDASFHTLGNKEVLKLPKVAFLCSRNCPAHLTPQIQQWAVKQQKSGICVISGFHSRIEKQVLHYLLQGSQPVILALACGIKKELEPELQPALAGGRLLIITRYAPSVTHPCEAKCHQRNCLMLELADEIVVAYASPGGSLERLCAGYRGGKLIKGLDQAD